VGTVHPRTPAPDCRRPVLVSRDSLDVSSVETRKECGACELTFCWSRQPPHFQFSVLVGDSPLPGFVGAQSPAAAAQLGVSQMKLPSTLIAAFTFSAALSWGAEQDYYQEFIRVFGSNSWSRSTPVAAFLINATNTGLKITNAVVDLKDVMASGEVSGVRLGMTMDELVARWGKPPEMHIIGSQGWLSGPFPAVRFSYSKLEVQFEPRTNAVKMLGFDARPLRLASGLSTRSKTNDFVAVLGRPERIQNVKGTFDLLIYRLPRWGMTLWFHNEDESQMFWVDLERLEGAVAGKDEI